MVETVKAPKILLTGATGFIGKNLLPRLLAAGHEVTTLGQYDSPEEFDQVRYDAVIHLGWAGVSAPHRHDWAMQTKNVAFLGRLLGMCGFWQPKVFLGFGSQAEYGHYADRRAGQYQEPFPICAYGAAKRAGFGMLRTLAATAAWPLRAVWLRLFSVYGPGEAAHWLIPSTIRRMRQGDPLDFTPGEQEMDYLHVDDVCAGILAALENEQLSGVYDLAAGNPVKLRTVIETLAELIQPTNPPVFGARPYRPNQIMRACANPQFWQDSGLKPTVSLRSGLEQLVTNSHV